MDLSNLKPARNSVRKNKVRLGKGQGSGKGGTSTKGHKGAKSRAGYKRKKGYEGGQMPLQRRVPKYGFTNINKKEYKGINISTLQNLADKKNLTSIDVQKLIDEGFASKKDLIKILGNGKLTSKLEVRAHAFSKSARQAIESLNGTAVKI
jgi:large subunit ribosomal protein L15